VVQQGRHINANLVIVARAHSDDEVQHLYKLGATNVIMAENQIGRAMITDIPRGPSPEVAAPALPPAPQPA
jgi:CPA2 family monovalent cation:H+ antiporter-2